jgi:hypothetical protein
MVYDLTRSILKKFRKPFHILNISVQQEAIISLASFPRVDSVQYHSIANRLATLDSSQISSSIIKSALILSEFQLLMEHGQQFVKRFDYNSLLFILFLLAFHKEGLLCPYFLFFPDRIAHYTQPFQFETPHPITEHSI